LLALLVLFGFYFRLETYEFGGFGDGSMYIDSAENMMNGGLFGVCRAWVNKECIATDVMYIHPWGYPILIIYVFKFLGFNYDYAVFLSTILNSLNIVLLFLLCYLLFNSKRIGYVCAFLYMINPIELVFSSTAHAEPASSFFIAASLLIFFTALRAKRMGLWLLFALVLSYALKIRVENLALVALFSFGIFLFQKKIKIGLNKLILPLVAFLVFSVDIFSFTAISIFKNYNLGNMSPAVIIFNTAKFIIGLAKPEWFLFAIPLALILIPMHIQNRKILFLVGGFLLFLLTLSMDNHYDLALNLSLGTLKSFFASPAWIRPRYFLILDVFLIVISAYIMLNVLDKVKNRLFHNSSTFKIESIYVVLIVVLFLVSGAEFYLNPTRFSQKNIEFSDLVDRCPKNAIILVDGLPYDPLYFSMFHPNLYSVMPTRVFMDYTDNHKFPNQDVYYVLFKEFEFEAEWNKETTLAFNRYLENRKVEIVAENDSYKLLKISAI